MKNVLRIAALIALAVISATAPAKAQSAFLPLVNNGGFANIPSTGVLLLRAPATTNASLRLPHGTAPSSPTNGDVWTTTSGLFARINGSTVSYIGSTGTINTNGMAYWSGATTLTSTAAPTNGQLLIGSTSNPPVLAAITAGTGIIVSNGAGSITISASGAGGATDSFARASIIMSAFGGL